ncbi:hypothetical protein PQR01_37135 [Paraburkholderia rhynchosiae]|uniref:Uncharacterized protein n=1 Tax=Paraburkholderia rhynchosiae TaxID=487049 RepID=A0ACC7NU84_9BURK
MGIKLRMPIAPDQEASFAPTVARTFRRRVDSENGHFVNVSWHERIKFVRFGELVESYKANGIVRGAITSGCS